VRVDLAPSEIRVLGCLLEKQRVTPDAYPLSLNALRLACNQATARDPVVDYDDHALRDALHRLERRGYVRLASGPGSRAPKYRHLLSERLPMDPGEQALMCVLMLRGPQTLGELNQRSERLHTFAGLDEVEAVLQRLAARELVRRQERRPGQKEQRYAQLLGADHEDSFSADPPPTLIAWQADRPLSTAPPNRTPAPAAPAAPLGPAEPDELAPLAGLEQRIVRLEREVAELREALGG
jgi:uncharacterized protein YceH (UPF0502 family)